MKDVTIKFSKLDKNLLDNLIRLLGRAKFESLEANEIIVGSDSLKWLSRLQKDIEDAAKAPPIQITSTEPIKGSKPKAPKAKKAE